MANIYSREQFKDYCLRRLGFPVVKINIDEDQIEDRIDDALQYYRDYHYDATEKYYLKHEIVQQDVDNKYLDIDPKILGVTRILPITDTLINRFNMFDIRYQLRLNDFYNFSSVSLVPYTMTMQHLSLMNELFVGQVPIRFQRHMNRLYIDWSWGDQEAPIGSIIIAECYAIIDETEFPKVWNDRWLKEYATNLIKRQWGVNLTKFSGIALPGGVTLDGNRIFREADQKIDQLEKEMIDTFSLPAEFFIG